MVLNASVKLLIANLLLQVPLIAPPLTFAYLRSLYVSIDTLQAGADANTPNNKGETPLHYAIRLGREDLVLELLKGGADVNMPTADVSTSFVIVPR